MAQKVEVLLVCDLHDDEVEGAETVAFGLDGTAYEIDVCDEHGAAMRDAFAPYVGAARRPGRAGAITSPRASRPAARSAAPAAPRGDRDRDKERVQEVRDWGRANGFSVSERGRLSGALVTAYENAH